MRPLILAPILLIATTGCKKGEDQYVGTWKGTSWTFVLSKSHTWTAPLNQRISMSGTWSVDGDDLTLTPTKIMDKPIAEMKQKMQAIASRYGTRGQSVADNIDKPNVFKLSSDAKTLTTDKAKDTNSGPPMTLTKVG